MKKLIEFPLDGGGTTVVEVEEAERTGEKRVARPGEVVETANETFQAAIEKVKPAVNSIIALLKGINAPDEIGVEFGIKMSAKAGAFLASADAEANFTVKLTWKNDAKSK